MTKTLLFPLLLLTILASCAQKEQPKRMIVHLYGKGEGKNEARSIGVFEFPSKTEKRLQLADELGQGRRQYSSPIPPAEFENLWNSLPAKDLAPFAKPWSKGFYDSRNYLFAINDKYPAPPRFYMVPPKSATPAVKAYAKRMRAMDPVPQGR